MWQPKRCVSIDSMSRGIVMTQGTLGVLGALVVKRKGGGKPRPYNSLLLLWRRAGETPPLQFSFAFVEEGRGNPAPTIFSSASRRRDMSRSCNTLSSRASGASRGICVRDRGASTTPRIPPLVRCAHSVGMTTPELLKIVGAGLIPALILLATVAASPSRLRQLRNVAAQEVCVD
jgi:hypothetical protein